MNTLRNLPMGVVAFAVLSAVLAGVLFARIPTSRAAPQAPALAAFPGAQGFGAGATGGRGGEVYKVTTLAASGAGSLQWALNQPGPRIIVFDVSGVIEGDVNIPHGDVTIAGQTAPGAGITIHGHLYTDYCTTFGNIIIRHIRVRAPMPDGDWPPEQHDAVQFSCNQVIILDHVDFSHGVDENLDMWGGAQDVTIQWSAITFPVYDGGHPDGPRHNYGMINGPDGGRISVHHTLFAHNSSRNPALAWGPAEVRNNVIYNYREGFVHHNPADGDFNIVGNYYKTGTNNSASPFWFDPENCDTVDSRYWMWNNWVDHPGTFTGRVDNPFTTPGFDYGFYDDTCLDASHFNQVGEFDFSSYPNHAAVTTDTPQAAYEDVLDQAGAWPRDIVNTWAVDDTRNRTGAWANRRPADWLEGLTPGTPPTDSDDDGMPNTWESAHGLDPQNGNDHNTVMASGYTAIEEYINGLADSLVPGFAPQAVADLRVTSASSGGGSATITLAWTPPLGAAAITLRYDDAPITAATWDSASSFASGLPGGATTHTATIPYTAGTLYFAHKSQNAAGNWSPLSNNTFWPTFNVLLPLVRR